MTTRDKDFVDARIAAGGGGGGVTAHTGLTALAWASSGHTGTASRVAAFNGGGAAAYLEVGADLQAWSTLLDTLASTSGTDGHVWRRAGGSWGKGALDHTALGSLAWASAAHTASTGTGTRVAAWTTGAATDLPLGASGGVQAWDADLDAIAALAPSTAGQMLRWSGSAWALTSAPSGVATKWQKLCADGTFRVDGGPHIAAFPKTSDTTLSSTGLTMSGLPTGRYDLVIRLVYTGNATARIKVQFVATNATIRWRVTDRDGGTQTNTESSVMDYPASAGEQMLVIEGVVNVTSSTGTVDLHMAQLVSNATATNIAQGTMHLSEKAA